MRKSKYTYKQQIERINASNLNYQKKAMKAYSFRFHKVNDATVIQKLDEAENRNDYVRQLVIKDIDNKK